ncbi:hypothetical protein P886_5022 [Alteromonadaceae bacterium 2753L.S.0a.02]|nr:hypothetical protein P886_5022 [Alteromonadaceae bacterium 2753L.S.0a.02]
MPVEPQPTFELTLANYFRERLQVLSEEITPKPHEDTLWYTGNMLARFGHSRELFCFDNGIVGLRPLALLYKDAHETRDRWERCLILRQLGDLALFLGALFPENYARRGIKKDYFVGMGGGAYDYLSENAQQNRHIFSELATMFTRMLELVERVCCKQNLFDATDILNLYRRWKDNGNPLLEEQLKALGISLPNNRVLN